MSTIKVDHVIIADAQFLVVETLKNLIQSDRQLNLTGVAGTKQELLRLLKDSRIDLLITDVETIDYASSDDFRRIREEYPQIKILILTNSISRMEFLSLSKAGIRNIVYKNVDRNELNSAIQATLKGKKFYSDEIMDLYLDVNESRYTVEESKNLTPSEVEIVRLIADGLTTKDIASRKNISHHTVSTHRKNIFRKLEVTSASELIICAIKSGWIDNIEYFI